MNCKPMVPPRQLFALLLTCFVVFAHTPHDSNEGDAHPPQPSNSNEDHAAPQHKPDSGGEPAPLHFPDNVTQDQMEALGFVCTHREVCGDSTVRGKYATCTCDPLCARHGTCCINSPYLGLSYKKTKCQILEKDSTNMRFVVSECDPEFSGPYDIQTKCESSTLDFKDPILSTPMTNPVSGFTYKNYYCACCNNDLVGAVFWRYFLGYTYDREFDGQYRPTYHITREEALRNLQYNEKAGRWESVIRRNAGTRFEETFPLRMSLTFEVPSNLVPLLETCPQNTVFECAESWTEPEIKKRCQEYTAIVTAGTRQYRNIDCARCNYWDDDSVSMCVHDPSKHSHVGPVFTALIDVNTADGNKVGKRQMCPAGQVFEPLLGKRTDCSKLTNPTCRFKCRRLVCSKRGYVVRNHRCVPRNSG